MDTINIVLYKIIPIEYFKTSKLAWKFTKNERKGLIFYLKCKCITLIYYFKYKCLKLITSATKFLYKNNAKIFSSNDLNRLYLHLNFAIISIFKQKLTSVQTWILTRLDLVANYSCENPNKYINLLKQLKYNKCKQLLYNTSVHTHNKSICYNFYNKTAEDNNISGNILRLEMQLKNSSIYKISKKFPQKTLYHFLRNPKELENIYKEKLINLGLNFNFLTKEEMKLFLEYLLNTGIIKKTLFNNMYNYFINTTLEISKNTFTNYKKILTEFNISHIIIEEDIHSINFIKFHLFYYHKPNSKFITAQFVTYSTNKPPIYFFYDDS